MMLHRLAAQWPTWLFFGVLWVMVQWFNVLHQTHFPGPDVFQFKAPGREFAATHRLSAVNLPYSPLDVQTLYAFYPPLYPFLYGVWCKAFGLSYESSVVFDGMNRLARTLLLLAWILLVIGKSPSVLEKRYLVTLGVFLLLMSQLPNNDDRPDEMGLSFALASLLSARRNKIGWSAFLLGLAGASSPTAGVFGAIGHFIFEFRKRRLIWIATGSLLVFVLVALPIVISDPSSIGRFLQGVHYNAVPYASRSAHARMDYEGLASFFYHLKLSMQMGKAMFLCFLVNLMASFLLLIRGVGAVEKRLVLIAVVFGLFSIGVFSIEPLYLWFSCAVLIVTIAAHAERRPILFAILFAGLSLMIVREGKLMIDGFIRSPEQRLSGVQAYLNSVLKTGDRIVVNSDSFFSVPFGQADNVDFVCNKVFRTYDYAWITESVTFQKVNEREKAPKTSSLCYWKPHCFELMADKRSSQILNVGSAYFVRGFGGMLYRNNCKITGIIPPF